MKRVLLNWIEDFWEFFEAIFGGLLAFINKHHITRQAVLWFTVWLTWDSYAAAKNFAFVTKTSGAELTLIIAAITVPVSALQGFIFKWYLDNTKDDI